MATFPATLYIGKNQDFIAIFLQNLNHKLENNPDIFIINSDYSIDNIRKLPAFFSTKPLKHPTKICVLQDAHLLQTTSQNSLLKILEEPGENNFILLTTSQPQKLLPTILSRCNTIVDSVETRHASSLHAFPQNSEQALLKSDELSADKTQVLPWLESQLFAYQQALIKNPLVENQQTIKKILKAIHMSRHNVDPKSIFDWLFLS